jgi:hypothetical protein
MPRLRSHYIRGRKIAAPEWGGMDMTPSIVVEARVVRESLDSGVLQAEDLPLWIDAVPEEFRPAFLEALEALGINH